MITPDAQQERALSRRPMLTTVQAAAVREMSDRIGGDTQISRDARGTFPCTIPSQSEMLLCGR